MGRDHESVALSDTLLDVPLSLSVPVSRPVLTLKAPGAQNVVGDVVELHCEAWRGSPPILYRLYHEDVTLGNSSAPFGGGASFNLSLTKEHFGNYSCEASNGPGAQRSEVLLLNITGMAPAVEQSWSVSLSQQPGRVSLTTVLLLLCYQRWGFSGWCCPGRCI